MNPTEAETALFGDTLSCDERLPAAFEPRDLDPRGVQGAADQAEMLLRGLAMAEDARRDEPDEPVGEARLQRLEAKVDLLIGLIGGLLAQASPPPAPRAVRWSWRGLRMEDGAAAVGQRGLVRVQAVAWMPQLLALPAEVVAVRTDGNARQAWLRFEHGGAGLGPALERHLFRLHRRAIADARRASQDGG